MKKLLIFLIRNLLSGQKTIEPGEIPVVEIKTYPVFTDFKDASEALPVMSKALSLFNNNYAVRYMIEEFIIEEQEHYNLLKGHLCLIEQIGMDFLYERAVSYAGFL